MENNEESNKAIDGLYAMLCSARSVNDDEVKLFRMIVEKNMILCRYRSLFIKIIKNDKKAMDPEVRYEVVKLFLQFLPQKEDSVDLVYYFQTYTGEDVCNYEAPVLMRAILDNDQRMIKMLVDAGADRAEAMDSYKEYSAKNARFVREFDKKQKMEAVTQKLEEKNLTAGKISEIMKVLPGQLVWYNAPGNGARVHAIQMVGDKLVRHANENSHTKETAGTTYKTTYRESVDLEPYSEITLIEGEEHTGDTDQISDSYSEQTGFFYYNRDLVLNVTEDQVDRINSLIADGKLKYILLMETGKKVSGEITINWDFEIRIGYYKSSEKKQYVFEDAHVCTLAGIITN